MNDQIIDEAIASAAAEAQPEAPEAEIDSNASEGEGDASQNGEPKDKAAQSDDDRPWPKKAQNALSRRDKQIGQLRQREKQLLSELQRFQQQTSQSNQPGKESKAPKEEDFDNYGDYLKAAAKYEARQEFEQQYAEQQKTTQQQQSAAMRQQWFEEKSDAFSESLIKTMETDTELKTLFEQNADVIQQLPQHIEEMFLHLSHEDATNAARALLKEDQLDALLSMPPALAAVFIGRAAERGAAIQKTKTISKAPAPMNANRGVGSASKSVETMSADELLASVKG